GEAMSSLLARIDGVHVLTSLTGFEALLRGLDVTVHGQPFFAGWGLTRDLAAPLSRRTRKLTLAELVAGTLILYPRYLDPVTERPCPPETLLQRFADGWKPKMTWVIRLRRLQGRIARMLGTVSR
ncbi:MAG TPA: beta-3-deoxy-D-manno-oct-2-ulosonic acid transferase, partial [Sphingomonas sp.]|nr:beta-3-deoxy-D-manno-oct-2-ulosonic acid transferase [Sphingomonas sp.]